MSPLRLPRSAWWPWLVGAAILAGFAPVYALASDHPALTPTSRWTVLATAALAVWGLRLALQRGAAWLRWGERHAGRALACLLAAYAVAGIALSAYRWRILTLGNVDSAIIIQSLRYTLDEGRLLFNTLEKASHLGVHNSPIYVLLAPLYALWRDPAPWLIALPPIALAVSGWPFFALARRRVGETPALALTAAYLLAPYIMARTVGDLYEMTLLPALLLPALYYYDRERFWPFVAFAALSLTIKESIAATVLLIGVYGLITRRRWPWVLAPALLAAASLVLSYGVVFPRWGEGVTSRAAALLGPLGATPAELLRRALANPLALARQVLTLPKLALMYQFFQPLLFLLPLLSAEVWLALPALGFSLLAQGGSVGLRAWESAILGPLLYAAAATGITRLSCWLERRADGLDRQRLCLFLSLGLFFATLACAPYWARRADYAPKPYWAAQRQAIALIPPGASLSAPDYMLARFADRALLQLQTGAPHWAEYHLVDLHWIESVRGHRLAESAARDYETLVLQAEQGQPGAAWQVLWSGEGLYVIKRKE